MASAPGSASSTPHRATLNEVLSRGKLIAQQKKAQAEAEAAGEVYDFPLDTLLLHDGTCDLTLQDLMNNEKISKAKAVKVMKKFRKDAEINAKKTEAGSLKGGAVLPEAVPSKSAAASDAMALQSEENDKKKKKGELKLDIAKPTKKKKPEEDVDEMDIQPKKKSKQVLEEESTKRLSKVTKCKAPPEEDDNEKSKQPAKEKQTKPPDADKPSQKRKQAAQVDDPTADMPETLPDTVVDEAMGDASAESGKKKKKDEKRRRQALQEMIDEIENQMAAPSEPELAKEAGEPEVARRVRCKTPPAASAAADKKEKKAKKEAKLKSAEAAGEASPKTPAAKRACSQDRQPDPTESQLDSQGRTWTLACRNALQVYC